MGLAEAEEVDRVTLGSLKTIHLNSHNNSSRILAEILNHYILSEIDNWIHLAAMENHLCVAFVFPHLILLAEKVKIALSHTKTYKEHTRLMQNKKSQIAENFKMYML